MSAERDILALSESSINFDRSHIPDSSCGKFITSGLTMFLPSAPLLTCLCRPNCIILSLFASVNLDLQHFCSHSIEYNHCILCLRHIFLQYILDRHRWGNLHRLDLGSGSFDFLPFSLLLFYSSRSTERADRIIHPKTKEADEPSHPITNNSKVLKHILISF